MRTPLIYLLFLVLGATSARAFDFLVIGGRVGQVGLTGGTATSFTNSVGFGFDLGLRKTDVADMIGIFTRSHHGTLTIDSLLVSAELPAWRFSSLDIVVGLGPGFYFFGDGSTNDTQFGIHGLLGVDVWLERMLRIGLEFRWNGVFAGTTAASFYTAMVRVAYMIEFE